MKFNFCKPFIALTLVGLYFLCLTSCVSRKDVAYFQSTTKSDSAAITAATKYIAKVQPGDILAVLVSSLSPEASAMFNPFPVSTAATINQTTQSTTLTPATGFLVDDAGYITLPLMGKVKVDGLSTKEAGDLLTQKLNKYLVDPTVNVRILNYRISVMGEVARPSIYTIPNEKISLPEALSLAGDLTIYGKRTNIMVIRERNGTREFGTVDLTKRDFFTSPYYYLQSGDVIYVEPNSGKITASDRAFQLTPIIISSVSLLTVIFATFIK